MKNKVMSVLALATLSLMACNKTNVNPSPNETASQITKSKWKITYLYDSSNGNITSTFQDYTFEFKDPNIITALSNNDTQAGLWITKIDDSKTELDLNFAASGIWDKLSDDWEVISVSNTKIELVDDNSNEEKLTFEKK